MQKFLKLSLLRAVFLLLVAVLPSNDPTGLLSSVASASSSNEVAISENELSEAVRRARDRVAEFKLIKQEADRIGVRVWLFGGTASGFGHYVRRDLQAKKGDRLLQLYDFSYDFLSIYQLTQDIDIVADGNLDQIDALQNALFSRYPMFGGVKSKWEVRSLRVTRGTPQSPGYKEALLNDFDFNNQNTDSNSIGLIELTDSNEPVIRDLRNWNSASNLYIQDLARGRITFIRSKRHFDTARAKAGTNPEMFSAIRYLSKAFQYDLTIKESDLKEIESIVKSTKDGEINAQSQNFYRLNDLAIKLVKQAMDLENAWNVMDQVGLRKRLLRLGDPDVYMSLSYWLNKEPLRSSPLGTSGTPVSALLKSGIIQSLIIAHDTRSFAAWVSMTRSMRLKPNLFISRTGVRTESAAAGNGFYAMPGGTGLWGSRITVRFELDPKAILGKDVDFTGRCFVIKNRNAIKTIRETVKVNFQEYLEMLKSGEFDNLEVPFQTTINDSIKRQAARGLSEFEEADLLQFVKAVLSPKTMRPNSQAAQAALNLLFSKEKLVMENPDIFASAISSGLLRWGTLSQATSLTSAKVLDHLLRHPEVISVFRSAPPLEALTDLILLDGLSSYPNLVDLAKQKIQQANNKGISDAQWIALLSQKKLYSNPDLLRYLLKHHHGAMNTFLEYVAQQNVTPVLEKILAESLQDIPKNSEIYLKALEKLMKSSHWKSTQVTRDLILASSKDVTKHEFLIDHDLFEIVNLAETPEIANNIFKGLKSSNLQGRSLSKLFQESSRPEWAVNPEWASNMEQLMSLMEIHHLAVEYTSLGESYIAKRNLILDQYAAHIAHWIDQRRFLPYIEVLFHSEVLSLYPQLVEKMLTQNLRPPSAWEMLRGKLPFPEGLNRKLWDGFLASDKWSKNKDLKLLCNGTPSVERIIRAHFNGRTIQVPGQFKIIESSFESQNNICLVNF